MSPKSTLPIDSAAYAPVADRIALFYERHPDGRIVTDLVSRDGGVIVFRARVYRTPAEQRPAATGWASEREGDGDINTVACLENTETSAIGRALANLGFLASARRPSAEEMAKVARARAAGRGNGARRPAPVAAARQPPPPPAIEPGREDALADTLDLVAAAAAAGLDRARATRLRERLVHDAPTLRQLDRVGRWLRGWLDDHDAR